MNQKGEMSRARVKIEKKFRRHLHVTIVKYILSLFGQTLSLFGRAFGRCGYLRRGAPTFPPDEEKSIFVGRLSGEQGYNLTTRYYYLRILPTLITSLKPPA